MYGSHATSNWWKTLTNYYRFFLVNFRIINYFQEKHRSSSLLLSLSLNWIMEVYKWRVTCVFFVWWFRKFDRYFMFMGIINVLFLLFFVNFGSSFIVTLGLPIRIREEIGTYQLYRTVLCYLISKSTESVELQYCLCV